VRIREELKEDNKLLSSTAKQHGVTDYAKFTNAGYLGMYNMYNWQLAKRRGISKGKLLDHMGRAELVANQFRTVMTEEKIKSDNVQGQARLEAVHKQVGKEVRDMVINNTGKTPEHLAVEEHIKEPKKRIRSDKKKLKQLEEN
jgi:DNA-damage-inducible protein D